jgi:hypothetical protein
MNATSVSAPAGDDAIVARQLRRTPRGPWRVAVRCAHGYPAVLAVAPLLEDGTPFPTTFWLSCPQLCAQAAAAESAGEAAVWSARACEDASLIVSMVAADAVYRAARAIESGGVDPCEGVGIAGQADPLAVKCLHARMAAAAAGLPDPVGRDLLSRCSLACEDVLCRQAPAERGAATARER